MVGDAAELGAFYSAAEFMNGTSNQLLQPLTYRVWDPKYRSFFYTDAQSDDSANCDRWTGLFDKQGAALYENDIIRAHYDWRLGWVRAVIVRHPSRPVYCAQATGPDGEELHIGFFCFEDAYRAGNLREHPGRLVPATEQFAAPASDKWWLSRAVFPSAAGASFN